MNKKRNKLLAAIVIIFLLIIGLIGGIIIYFKSSIKLTNDFYSGNLCGDLDAPCELTSFVVDEGAYGKSTLIKLENENIIKNSDMVYFYNRIFTGYSFVAGYFEIPHYVDGNPLTIDQLLAFLSDPKNAHQSTVMIHFDEGDFIKSFAKQIGEATTVSENRILAYWENEDELSKYIDEYPFLSNDILNPDIKYPLEGYLFPDTYEFYEFTNEDEVTRTFLDRTLEIYNENIDLFESSDLSPHEIFTLASMVQWESGSIKDSSKIAGVFLNRLEDGIDHGVYGLQSTVTACYAFDLTKEECYAIGDTTEITEAYDAYNTYQIDGLPPGPVCNPNRLCIEAVLNADRSGDYYYFSADLCNGGTVFARTYPEHLNNVDRYFVPCS